MKQKTDKRDTYHIYRINKGNLNNYSDYVFKASKRMAELAIFMDVDFSEKSVLQEENAYFNVTHTRIHGFNPFTTEPLAIFLLLEIDNLGIIH